MRRVDRAPKVVLQHLGVILVMIVMIVVMIVLMAMMMVVTGVAKIEQNDEDESLFKVE